MKIQAIKNMQKKVWFAITILLLTGGILTAGEPDPADHGVNPEMLPTQEGEMIPLTTSKGRAFQAYEVRPRGGVSVLSILLIHEWWGLNDNIKSIADQFALLGYRALAVDLYGGKVSSNAEEASKFMSEVRPDETLEKLMSSLDYLAIDSEKIGVIGWCFGGGWALKASLASPQLVSATIVYYGELVTDPDELKKLRAPVLGIFANEDKWIDPKWVEGFRGALEQAGVRHEIHSYEAGHAFANPRNKNFNEAAYRDAWEKTIDFLKKNLG